MEEVEFGEEERWGSRSGSIRAFFRRHGPKFVVFLKIVSVTLMLVSLLVVKSTTNQKTLSEWEQIFLGIPDSQNLRTYLKDYTAAPHPAGSTEDYDTAIYTKQKFEEFGFSSWITEHQVLLSFPLNRSLKLIDTTYCERLLKF
jgi:hypothetical protein